MSAPTRYYFNPENFSNADEIATSEIKEKLAEKVEKLLSEITSPVRKVAPGSREMRYYWVSRANLGYVFTDFQKPENSRSVVGKGSKRLFERIRSNYYCVIFSKHLAHNMREIQLSEDKKAIVINIDHFKKFSSVISRENFVDLFLYKFDNLEVEKVVTEWIVDSREKFPSLALTQGITISGIIDMIERYHIHSPEDLSELLRTGANALMSKIEDNYEFYNRTLEEFRVLIHKERPEGGARFDKEDQLKGFLKKHPWIIDFTYDEKNVQDGPSDRFFDVFLVNSYFGYKKGLLIELKLPDEKIEKQYRSTVAVTAPVTDALSQILDYVINLQREEREKSPNDPDRAWKRIFVDAMIIIGKEMSEHIEVLNRYLHNVEIKTYGQIYDDAKRRLPMFSRDRNSPDDSKGPIEKNTID